MTSLISIVVPCYKSADCLDALAGAIATALTGKVACFELVLVDVLPTADKPGG
jgi:hypothetical protein